MVMAAVCCTTTVTTALSCSSRPCFQHTGTSYNSSASLARPCAGLRRDLSLNGRNSERRCLDSRRLVVERSRRRVGGVRAGLPVISSVPVVGPLASAVLNPALLFIVYAAGAFRFYSGFQKLLMLTPELRRSA